MSKEHFESEYTTLNGFGKKQLEKFGWKSGDGLGKERDGSKDFVKVTKRSENEGLGATKNNKMTNYWWENMYNNLLQKPSKQETETKSDSEDAEDNERTLPQKKNEESLSIQYRYGGSFIKASSNNQIKSIESIKVEKKQKVVETSSNTDSSDSETEAAATTTKIVKSTVLRNDMFEACEGNTLKKYRQVGKMKRLEEADKKLKEQMEKMRSQMEQSQKKTSLQHQNTANVKKEEEHKKTTPAKLKNVKIESESEEEEEPQQKPTKKIVSIKKEESDSESIEESIPKNKTNKNKTKLDEKESTKPNKRKAITEQASESEISDFEAEQPKAKKFKIKNR